MNVTKQIVKKHAFVLIVLMAVQMSVVNAQAPMQAQGDFLRGELLKPDVKGEMQSIPEYDVSVLKSEMLEFQSHKQDASRINWKDQVVDTQKTLPAISQKLKNVVGMALKYSDPEGVGKRPQELVTETMSVGQRLTLLNVYQEDNDYAAAANMARTLIDDPNLAEYEDFLALVSARNYWLSKAGKSSFYHQLIDQARKSPDPDVMNQAALWEEAIAEPKRYESYTLCFQIWSTVHNDLLYREKSGNLSMKMLKTGKVIYENLEKAGSDGPEVQIRLGRIASLMAEAAFQWHDENMILWAVDAVEPLTGINIDDKLAPSYYHAYFKYVQGDYNAAYGEFESVFTTGHACDVTANSGYMMADCQMHLGDWGSAYDSLILLYDHYPDQHFIIDKADNLMEKLLSRDEIISAKQ